MQPSAAHGTAFRRSPALCKASGFMIETVQSRRIVGIKISEAIVRSTKNRKLCNIFLGCTVTIKQYAAPTRKKIAESNWNPWKHWRNHCYLKGFSLPSSWTKKISARKAQKFQLFQPLGTQCVMGVQSVRAKARRKLMHLSLRLAFARTDCTPMTHCVPMGRNSWDDWLFCHFIYSVRQSCVFTTL